MSRATIFRACDLFIASNINLPELPQASGQRVGCRFEVLPAGGSVGGDVRWFHQWRVADKDSIPWLRLGRNRAGYLLRFSNLGDFLVSRDGTDVKCLPLPGIPEPTLRHLFLDQVLPLILSRRERLVLHASAVDVGHGAVAFVGMSGQGKSTLAASFGRQGYSLLSDDCLVLRESTEGWVAIPSYPGVRLWPDTADGVFDSEMPITEVAHYTSKGRVVSPLVVPFSDVRCPLQCLYFLNADERTSSPAVSIAPLARRDAFLKLLNFAFNLDITDQEFLKSQFKAIALVTGQVRCYSLRYRREFSALSEVRQIIIDERQGN